MAFRLVGPGRALYWLTLTLVALGVLLLRRVLLAPLVTPARAMPLRAEAIGIDVRRAVDRLCAGGRAGGLAGALFLLAKGSISPEALAVAKSVDGLVMVLLGGVQTLAGPLLGAGALTWLHDTVARNTDYWRALLGATMLLLVLAFPQGWPVLPRPGGPAAGLHERAAAAGDGPFARLWRRAGGRWRGLFAA